jgi:hypothetical protein
LTGTVTDKGTSQPISGATVTCGAASATTNASGTYLLTIPVGADYRASAVADGYYSSVRLGVSMTGGESKVLDFALTPEFPDIAGDFWASGEVASCVGMGIVAGYDDGLYHPDWPVTRDQMAVYISRALAEGDANVPDFAETPTFPDVGPTHWALKYVQYVVAAEVVGGYDDGLYHPDLRVDRGQMAVFVSRALAGGDSSVPSGPAVPTFPDVPTQFWAYRHIEYCVDEAVVAGYPDGAYHPEIIVTRDQMAVYVARAFDLTG